MKVNVPNAQDQIFVGSEVPFIDEPSLSHREDALTNVDVCTLYEILLGRVPESDQVVEKYLHFHQSIAALGRSLCASDEFPLRVKRETDGALTRADVQALYEMLLGRQPESKEVIEIQRSRHDSAIQLARSICDSDEVHLGVSGVVSPSLTRADVRLLNKILFGHELQNDDTLEEQLSLHQSAISLAQWLCNPDQVSVRLRRRFDDALTMADVCALYQIILGRRPEGDRAVEARSAHKSATSLADSLCDTAEFCARIRYEGDRTLSRADVRELYEIVLGRQPEDSEIIEKQAREHKSAIALTRSLCRSEEFGMRLKRGADRLFDGYRSEEINILRRHLVYSAPEGGFVKDFVGTRMRVEFNTAVSAFSGVVFDRIPVPHDFRVEAIEWIGVLKAVESSGPHFVAIELGAGWGPWAVSSGHVARGLGKTVRMYAVEADPGKVSYIAQHMVDNGFDPDDHVIFGGIAGACDGFAYFPVIDATGNWSGEAVYGNPPEGDYQKLPSISLRTLMKDEEIVDLIHFDIQGAEFDVVEGSVDQLSAKVKWVVIGTHSRSIEGRLIDLLLRTNWSLENEQPCRCFYKGGRSDIFIDGTQVWKNLAFAT
jgi:FkbM family methyltransferase